MPCWLPGDHETLPKPPCTAQMTPGVFPRMPPCPHTVSLLPVGSPRWTPWQLNLKRILFIPPRALGRTYMCPRVPTWDGWNDKKKKSWVLEVCSWICLAGWARGDANGIGHSMWGNLTWSSLGCYSSLIMSQDTHWWTTQQQVGCRSSVLRNR